MNVSSAGGWGGVVCIFWLEGDFFRKRWSCESPLIGSLGALIDEEVDKLVDELVDKLVDEWVDEEVEIC